MCKLSENPQSFRFLTKAQVELEPLRCQTARRKRNRHSPTCLAMELTRKPDLILALWSHARSFAFVDLSAILMPSDECSSSQGTLSTFSSGALPLFG